MNLEERILELVKEEHITISELEKKLGTQLGKFGGAIEFLGKYGLIDLLPSGTKEGPRVQITPRGLQLLDLPKLPEDESPSDLLELSEKHWGDEFDAFRHQNVAGILTLPKTKREKDKTIDIYTQSQQVESVKGIAAMATRFGIKNSDVIRAMWFIAKDTVGAKLERDVKEVKHKKNERNS